jgi:anti-sigma regulatory factor (Ser/Thr protein kinase)
LALAEPVEVLHEVQGWGENVRAMSERRIVTLAGSEPLLANPESLLADGSETVVTLDLSEVTFVCPLDLVAIAAWSTSLPAGERGEVRIPTSPTASYLERMKLLEFLRVQGWRVPHPETVPWEDLPDRLLEVTTLDDPNAVEVLGDRLPKLWAGRTGDPKRSRALHFAFGELSDNATTHSGAAPIIVAAQRYTGTTSPHPARLELAVADAGVGIPDHLRRNPEYMDLGDDAEAIAEALRPGVSGTRDRRGYGFFDVLREMSEVGEGELFVASGGAAMWVPFGAPGRRRRRTALGGIVRGSWLQVRLFE